MSNSPSAPNYSLPANTALDIRPITPPIFDDYGNEPRIVRRLTIDGPVSVGIDGRHGKRHSRATQGQTAAL
jgi:hypothetical protein